MRITPLREAAPIFGAAEPDFDPEPAYNIAPGRPIAVIVEDGKKRIVSMHWGLIPRWAKDRSIANRLINARAESILDKPSFRDSFRKRRCLIIADGFFEWTTAGATKTPVYLHLSHGHPFGMAGVYDRWTSPEGEEIISCAIITTEANDFVRRFHHRMPVIIDPVDGDRWLDPDSDSALLQSLLKPCDPRAMAGHEVTMRVNSAAFAGPECIVPCK